MNVIGSSEITYEQLTAYMENVIGLPVSINAYGERAYTGTLAELKPFKYKEDTDIVWAWYHITGGSKVGLGPNGIWRCKLSPTIYPNDTLFLTEHGVPLGMVCASTHLIDPPVHYIFLNGVDFGYWNMMIGLCGDVRGTLMTISETLRAVRNTG